MSTLKKNIDVVFTGGKPFTPAVTEERVRAYSVPVIPTVAPLSVRWRFIPGTLTDSAVRGYGDYSGFYVPYYV